MTGLPSAEPRTVAEAIAAGHQQPHTSNPFLWSSTFRETFNLDRCLGDAGIAPAISMEQATFSISLRPARRLSLCESVTSDNCHDSLNLFMIRRFRHRGLRRLYEDDDRRELNPEHVDKVARMLARLEG